MDIIAFFLGGIRVIFGFLLVLLIPGLLISLVYFPKPSDLRISERLVYAVILSIGSVILCVLFMDVVLGIDTSPLNVILFITEFCLFLALLWTIRSLFLTFSITEKIAERTKKITDNSGRIVQERMNKAVDKVKQYQNTLLKKDKNL